MRDDSAEVLIVGGGPAGASLAAALAAGGLDVRLLEARSDRPDQGRGEVIYPWGGVYLDRLGLLEPLRARGLHPMPQVATYVGPDVQEVAAWSRPDAPPTPAFGMYLPALQEALLQHAQALGVRIERPARARQLLDRSPPCVLVHSGDRARSARARVVVAADGRHSAAQQWIGAHRVADPVWRHIVSARVRGVDLDPSTLHIGHGHREKVLALPYGDGIWRLYAICSAEDARACRGEGGLAHLVRVASRLLPIGALTSVTGEGPVFRYAGHSLHVSPGGADALTLAGDAAGYTDPCMAMGLSLSFRDAYTLAEELLKTGPEVAALRRFEDRRAVYFGLHQAHVRWSMRLWFEDGPAADGLRRQVLLARFDDPAAGGWEDIYTDGVDGLDLTAGRRAAFFGGDPDPWPGEEV